MDKSDSHSEKPGNKIRWLLGITIMFICILALFMNRPLEWTFGPRPPIPRDARNLNVDVSSGGSIGIGQRFITFETGLSVDTLQEFYLTQLLKHGWTHQGTIRATDPPCDRYSLEKYYPYTELMDQYTRADNNKTLIVNVWFQGAATAAPENRFVSLRETLSVMTFTPPPTPMTEGPPEDTIIGSWESTDDATSTYVFCFDEGGKLRLLLPDFFSAGGEYNWVENGAIRLTLESTSTHLFGDNELCTRAPAFLKNFCFRQVIDAVPSYPAPGESFTPTPALRATVVGGPYPGPSMVTVQSGIDEVFTVNIDGYTMTLTHESGINQIFHRVTGE